MARAALSIAVAMAVGLGGQALRVEESQRIRGRVTDKTGKPIAQAWISAQPLAGQLQYPSTTKGETNAEGWFNLTMPFAGARYKLWVGRTGYSDTSVDAVAGDDRSIEVRLKRAKPRILSGSVVSSVTRQSVGGAKVVLIPGYGRREAVTDGAGRFEFTGLPELFVGAGEVYAEHGSLISSLRTIDTAKALALGPPAGLEGIVCERDTGKPVADCEVILRPRYNSGFRMQVRTNENGRYRFEHIPPGEYYQVGASHAEWYEPPTWGKMLERPELPLRAGHIGYYQIALVRRVTVQGTVVGIDGQPVAGVAVALPASSTQTDAQGQFLLRTGVVNETTTIEAFHPTAGVGRAEVFIDEERPDKVTIRLGGTMRVRGQVTDSEGRPIKGVEVSTGLGPHAKVKTDAAGRFDFGWVPLAVPEGDEQTITCRAPRPASFCDPRFPFGESGDQHPFDEPKKRMEEPAVDTAFFRDKQVTCKAGPGKEIDLSVTLEPASVITFAGRVLDHEGTPVPDARLLLFAGNANPKTWKDDLHPMRRMLSSHIPSPEEVNVPIARTTADRRGEWSVQVVKETGESIRGLSSRAKRAIDVSRVSLGIECPSGTSILMRDIVLGEGQTEKRIDVKLPPPANGVRAIIVDTQGAPLAGIDVRTSYPGQPLTTDSQGRLLIEREHRDKFNLHVTSPGWSILSPSPDGRGSGIALDSKQQDGHEVRIVLARPGRLTVAARWSTGEAVTEYELLDHRTWVADPRGEFAFDTFPAGKHNIRARSVEGVVGSAAVDLQPDGRAAVEIVLPRPEHSLRGQVIDATDSPFHGAKVSVKGPAFETTMLPDENGRFTLKVPPGSYRVSAHSLADRFSKVIGGADVKLGPRVADHAGPDTLGQATPEAEVLIRVK